MIELFGDPRRRRSELGAIVHHFGIPAALARHLAQRERVHTIVDRTGVRRVDRDGVDERVAAPQQPPDVANVAMAAGIGAVGNQENRRPLVLPDVEQRQRLHHRVVDAGAAIWLDIIQSIAKLPGSKGPPHLHARRVVEDDDEDLVLGVQQVGHKPVEREPRVVDALPVHALADVEHHPHAERDAVAREVGDRLPLGVFEYLEVFAPEVPDQTSVLVDHRGRHLDEVDTGPEDVVGPPASLLAG